MPVGGVPSRSVRMFATPLLAFPLHDPPDQPAVSTEGAAMRLPAIASAMVALPTAGFFLAAPAGADPQVDVTGSYTVDGTGATWTVTSCGPGCVDAASSDGTKRHLHLSDHRWVSVPYVGSVLCPLDQSRAAAEMVTTVNAEFTHYTDEMLRPVGTCDNGYPAIGETENAVGHGLVKNG